MLTKIAAGLWTIMIIWGSSMPGSDASKLNFLGFEGADKVIHFSVYAMMVLLWSIALKSTGKKIGGARLAFYSSVVLGIVLEILQSSIFEGRSFEIYDIIANIMGSIIGLILFYKLF